MHRQVSRRLGGTSAAGFIDLQDVICPQLNGATYEHAIVFNREASINEDCYQKIEIGRLGKNVACTRLGDTHRVCQITVFAVDDHPRGSAPIPDQPDNVDRVAISEMKLGHNEVDLPF